ncbi:MAG TPA: anti-sigma factor [Candidatus Acidoferrales bacterium]|nr:anti-sigma factor [Candidatus Acidoferrales bacterium]
MTHDCGFLDDVAVFALGALEPQQAAATRAHLATCATCQEEYRTIAPAVRALALGVEPASPTPLLKRRLMRLIAEPRRPRRLSFALLAACTVLVIALGISLAALNGARARFAAELADITSPQAQRYVVANGEVVRAGSHLYIALHGAADLPPGKAYQAWTMRSGSHRVAPSVTFRTNNGMALIQLPVDAKTLSAVALSIEPAGGSTQPTNAPLFLVKLS